MIVSLNPSVRDGTLIATARVWSMIYITVFNAGAVRLAFTKGELGQQNMDVNNGIPQSQLDGTKGYQWRGPLFAINNSSVDSVSIDVQVVPLLG